MQCRYINLDHATERRAAIEASFNKTARPGWSLTRFKALDAEYVERHSVAGRKNAVEKACYLSHKTLIEAHAGCAGHLVVLEDDAEFGMATSEVVDGFLRQNPDADWDLLFLDVCTHGVEDMLKLYFNRQGLMNARKVVPLDLAKMPFFGCNAYIVNGKSVDKIVACLEAGIPVDVEYDLYLASQIRQGRLKAAVLFPFVTTLSEQATRSQIQPASVVKLNQARNLFRNLMWLESEPGMMAASLAELEALVATTTHKTFFTILSALIMSFEESRIPAGTA
jgi:GR25 family glycosyltransferase involved in LPS biosynthesis